MAIFFQLELKFTSINISFLVNLEKKERLSIKLELANVKAIKRIKQSIGLNFFPNLDGVAATLHRIDLKK